MKRRLIVDLTSCPEKSGGMRLWAEAISSALSRRPAGEEILVLAPLWLKGSFQDKEHLRFKFVKVDNFLLRFAQQQLVGASLFYIFRADRYISLNAVYPLLVRRRLATVLCHDWRHLRQPSEFSFFRRLYRRIWVLSVGRAGKVFAVSIKTKKETIGVSGRSDIRVLEPGVSHLLNIDESRPDQFRWDGDFLVTFAQHTNKKPEIVIEALAESKKELALIILGCDPKKGQELIRLSKNLGVQSRVFIMDFLPLSNYKWVIRNALAVILLTSDEGFGIPVIEARSLGTPIVVSANAGFEAIFDDDISVVEDDALALAWEISHLRKMPSRQEFNRQWEDVLNELIA